MTKVTTSKVGMDRLGVDFQLNGRGTKGFVGGNADDLALNQGSEKRFHDSSGILMVDEWGERFE